MNNKQVFACYNLDINHRIKSSSGGIFYLLGRYIVNHGGIVFGAAFDEKWEVKHISISSLDELVHLLGSKYVQSDMNNILLNIKSAIESKREVLVTGTPCQIAGVHNFLGKKYDNLTTIDFICHGVPSRSIWREYLKKISFGRKIKSINFRDKTKGWKEYGLKIEFDNGQVYYSSFRKDWYMQGFLKNLFLRKCCYLCKFSKVDRVSDITIFDFWGIEHYIPDMFNYYGTSGVIIHSLKGREIFDNIQVDMKIYPTSIKNVISGNKLLTHHLGHEPLRNTFYKLYSNKRDLIKCIIMCIILRHIFMKIKKYICRKK